MRSLLSLSALLITFFAQAQNTDPWPSTGNVGIGTTTPAAKLHLKDATSGTALLRLSDDTYWTDFIQNSYNTTINAHSNFILNWGNNTMQLSGNVAGKFHMTASYGAFVNGYSGFKVGATEKFGFFTHGSTNAFSAMGGNRTDNNNWGLSLYNMNAGAYGEAIRILSNGNVGIGTITPGANLEVFSSNSGFVAGFNSNLRLRGAAPAMQFWDVNNNNGWQVGAENGSLFFSSMSSLTGHDYRFFLQGNGNVGIGTTAPSAQLHTTGTVRMAGLGNNDTYTKILAGDANGNLAWRDAATLGGGGTNSWLQGGTAVVAAVNIGTSTNYDLPIVTNNIERIRVTKDGSVGIGTLPAQIGTDYKLYVEGKIRTRKVRVDVETWPDYVFQKDYSLPSLPEVEKFIQQHAHLPGVPSAQEVKEKGLDLGDNQALLLKKIEELTLYVIALQKEVEGLKKDKTSR